MAAGNLAEYELLRPQYGDLGNARDPHHRQPFEELEHHAFDPRPYPAPQKRRPHGLLQTLLLRPRSRTSLLAAALLAIGFSLFVILPPGDRAGRSLPEPGTVSGRIAGAAPAPAPDRVVALREGDASGSSAGEESDPSPARSAPPPLPTADVDEGEGVAQDAVDQTDPEPADKSVGVPATGSNEDGGAEPPNVLAPDQPASEDTFDAPGDDTEVPGTQDDDDGDNEDSLEGTLLGTPSELQPTRTAGITADPAVTGVAASSTESEGEKAGRRNGEAGTPEEAERSGDAVEMAKEAEDDGDTVEKANEAEDDGDAVEMAKEAEDDDDAAGEPDGAQESDDAVEKTEGEKKGQDAVKKTEGPERVDGAVEKTEGPEKGDVPVKNTEGLEEKNDTVTGDRPSQSLTGSAGGDPAGSAGGDPAGSAGGDPAVQIGGRGSADASGEKAGAATENMIGGTHGPTEDADRVYADEESVPAANSDATVGADPENPVSEFDTTTTAVGGTGGDRTQTVAGSGGISGGRTTPIHPSPTSAHAGETETVETLGSAPETAAAAEAPGLSTPPPTPHPAVPTVDSAVSPSATSDDGHGQVSTESFADRGGEPANDPQDLSDSARPVAAAAEAAPVADYGDGATTPGAQNRPTPEIRDEEPANDDAAAASAGDEATAVGGELSGAGSDADAGRALDDDEEEEGETVAGHTYGRAAGEEDDGPAAGSVVKMTEFTGKTRRVS